MENGVNTPRHFLRRPIKPDNRNTARLVSGKVSLSGIYGDLSEKLLSTRCAAEFQGAAGFFDAPVAEVLAEFEGCGKTLDA
jgi:hypothetical protein